MIGFESITKQNFLDFETRRISKEVYSKRNFKISSFRTPLVAKKEMNYKSLTKADVLIIFFRPVYFYLAGIYWVDLSSKVGGLSTHSNQ